MLRTISWICFLLAGAILLIAIVPAINELVGLYEGVAADPMAEPEVAEEDRPKRMLDALKVGILAVPFLVVAVAFRVAGSLTRR